MDSEKKEVHAQSSQIKCLAECPKCRSAGVKGMCGFDAGHTSGHRCNRCSHIWE